MASNNNSLYKYFSQSFMVSSNFQFDTNNLQTIMYIQLTILIWKIIYKSLYGFENSFFYLIKKCSPMVRETWVQS